MPGLLGQDDPYSGLGLLGAQLLSQTSPNFGVGFGNALTQTMLLQQKMREDEVRKRLLAQQIQSGEFDLSQRQKVAADQDAIQKAMQAYPGQSGQPQTMPGGKGVALGAPAESKADMSQRFTVLAERLEAIGSPDALARAKQYRDLAEKYRPEVKETKTLVQDGQRVTVNIMKDGTTQVVPFAPDQEKAHFADVGNGIVAVDPFTGKPVGQAMVKGVSPDQLLQSNVTMRGQNLTDARARDLNAITKQGQNQQVLETANGPILVDKRNASATPVTIGGTPVPGESQLKKQVAAKGVMDLLDEAEKHLPNATNSMGGRAVDYGARVFGHSTQGDRETASLQAIEGALLAQMPRMEGPQSNYDVENYKRAAGQIANASIPREIRQQAINTIRDIQKRYAGSASNLPDPLGLRK